MLDGWDLSRSGLFLDFDGTLSEIVPTPEEARPVAEAVGLLDALASRAAVVAVVTGRRAADVAGLLAVGPAVRIYGLYGREDRTGAAPSGGIAEARAEIERTAALVPGARVEDKGPHVAVHYRAATDRASAGRVLAERLAEVASRHGLELLPGKAVVELAPAGGPTKGDVVERVARAEGLAHVAYAGDDVADLAAFEAVERLRREGRDGVAIAIRGAETPPELLSRADLIVDGPGGLAAVLRDLLR